MDVTRLLVLERHLAYVQRLLGDGDATWTGHDGLGLVQGVVPTQRYESLRGALDGGQVWGPGVWPDRVMGAAYRDPPDPVSVHGTSMDFHGEGPAVRSARRLPPRRGERQLGEGVLVGVVDNGMRSHPWLEGGYLASPQDFQPYDGSGLADGVRDHAGHATFVTGLVLQQAQAAGVWVERALDPVGTGLASAVAGAALRLARRGVHVLNLSLGCFDDDPRARMVMEQLVHRLHEVNPALVVVAAAGNLGGEDEPATPADFWPAALPGVVAVGAVEEPDEQGRLCWPDWSNRGPWVDLAAPGHQLLSTYLYDSRGVGRAEEAPDGPAVGAAPVSYRGWARWSGTSFSAAVVSGAIAATMDEHGLSAGEAVEHLREGRQWDRWTEPDDDVPSVPVVRPTDWHGDLPAFAAPWWA